MHWSYLISSNLVMNHGQKCMVMELALTRHCTMLIFVWLKYVDVFNCVYIWLTNLDKCVVFAAFVGASWTLKGSTYASIKSTWLIRLSDLVMSVNYMANGCAFHPEDSQQNLCLTVQITQCINTLHFTQVNSLILVQTYLSFRNWLVKQADIAI